MSIEANGRLDRHWDECIVDVEHRGYVYSLSLMVKKVLRDFADNSEALALEWIDYNIIGFYIKPEAGYSPMIIDDYNHELDELVYIGELEL